MSKEELEKNINERLDYLEQELKDISKMSEMLKKLKTLKKDSV